MEIWRPDNEENTPTDVICRWAIELGEETWLRCGYPHGQELILEAAREAQHNFSAQEQLNCLRTRIYSLLLYTLNCVHLRYEEVKAMEIPQVIHRLLAQNNLAYLDHMDSIF